MKAFPRVSNTKLFLVGGSVRDIVMDRPAKDRDFVAVTDFSFEEFCNALQLSGAKLFQIRPEFLTVRCLIEGEPIDIAFPRAESDYVDGRHPSVVSRIQSGQIMDILRADAARRDFTINSMFMDEQGKIIDFFGGQSDRRMQLIRAVGEPRVRFEEDSLRILRGMRFACRFNFQIDILTEVAMLSAAPLLKNVAAERIRDEVDAALLANPVRAFSIMNGLGLFEPILEKGVTFSATLKERK